jgi:PAS domain S-box-containing protein
MDETSGGNEERSGGGEWLRPTLSRIGEAVVTTDRENRITFLNTVAEKLTGWSQEAVGEPLARVVRIVEEGSREPVALPTVQDFREGREAEAFEHSLVVDRDGTELAIEGSASPLLNTAGEVAGVEFDFRDITDQRATQRALEKSVRYARDIIATLREPFLVLDAQLRVDQANRAFYTAFEVSPGETENRLVFELGNGQWDIPRLRKLLEEVSSRNEPIEDYEVEHSFPHIGTRTMLLNARPFPPDAVDPEAILLAIQDVTPQRESTLRQRAEKLAEIDR